LVIGGGALGIQLATDVKEVHGETEVTVLHSREQLLPRFDKQMHEHGKASPSYLLLMRVEPLT
jgi:pyruvate/2-oxoglutarate dehydrogenase complex dihydrolipoamide dehydrogenase (E3) component